MLQARRAGVLLMLLFAAACATSGRQVQPDAPVLTGEEIATVSVATAYEAVARLRPGYLRGSGAQAPVVVMNNHVIGGVNALRDIAAYRVQEIRYLTPAEAARRLGSGHEGGAIIVVTRRAS